MPFKRVWDSSCPRTYDRWECDGITWMIQDLPPEEDEEALRVYVEQFVPDEVLCAVSGLEKEPVSLRSMSDYWRHCIAQRMTLACYAEVEGKKTLAAMNCCVVKIEGEKDPCKIEGEAWINVYDVLKVIDENLNSFKYLGLDTILCAFGLIVKREYRGNKLGARLLAAREPLAISLGLKGTSTVFSGPAAQKSAARAGFETAYEITLKELAAAGLNYPRDDRVIKLMVKKYMD